MADAATINTIAMGCVALGVALWTLSPFAERVAGDPGALSVLGGGLALFLTAAVMLYGDFREAPSRLAVVPMVLVGWGLLSYIFFRFARRSHLRPEKLDLSGDRHCVPKLVDGTQYDSTPYSKRSIRTRLEVSARAFPTDCDLRVGVSASGRAYYGLYYTTGKPHASPYVFITCQNRGNDCLAFAQIRGTSGISEGPVTVRVDHTVSSSGDTVVVRTTVSASVGASGGSLGVSGGGAGVSVGLPNNSREFREEMGTFVWRCVPGQPR